MILVTSRNLAIDVSDGAILGIGIWRSRFQLVYKIAPTNVAA